MPPEDGNPLKVLHVSDIHLGSGLSHGRTNPATGLNTRLEDFAAALVHCVDQALAHAVDAVLFTGDAFPDATPPPLVQELFARQFYRLAQAQIPTLLLVGNHDQRAQGQGGASLCIFRTLGVPGVIVGDSLETHRLSTPHGPLQVVTLPWITRAALMTRPEVEGLSMAEVNEALLQRLHLALEGELRQLDPAVPAILAGHAMVANARLGAERFLAAGKGLLIPLSLLARAELCYVALGHVHRHQVLCQEPPVVYAGSLERVDFSETEEEKGYVLVEIEAPGRPARFTFCPVPTRPMHSLSVNLEKATDPEAQILATLAQANLQDAIVRLTYRLRPDQLDQIRESVLHQALGVAHSYTIQPDLVSQLARPRLPDLPLTRSLDPLTALEEYLNLRPELEALRADLLRTAQSLLQAEAETEVATGRPAVTPELVSSEPHAPSPGLEAGGSPEAGSEGPVDGSPGGKRRRPAGRAKSSQLPLL
ncbi:MAG: exonuclease SbcCD subunit D [Gloeomargaritaceae cyanobacterium C42_A2020_066]|nr:exonuclease SbcCD subunit D [Gloeomargaritaceae cyanobacterium C42_A2020_066]